MPDLAAVLRAALPPGVVLGQGRDAPLWPGEDVLGAVPACVAVFALGRGAAHDGMRALGVPPVAIPGLPDRSPICPDPVTGSISHCDGGCFAIAGLRADYAGNGPELEPLQPLDRSQWPVILRPGEKGLDPLMMCLSQRKAPTRRNSRSPQP